MRIIKNINNNYAIAIDSVGNRVVISGKGVGFGEVPRELEDLTIINRSFYDVDEQYITMIRDIPEEIISISSQIVDNARNTLDNQISSNIIFTLADHINFCIERHKNNMNIKLPIVYDIKHLFEKEYEIGKNGISLIKERLKIWLPDDEAAYIALHLINAEEQDKNKNEIKDEVIVDDITKIVEKNFNIEIDKENVNYSRFVSHLHYLLKRGKTKHLIESSNNKLFLTMRDDYPKTHECAEDVSEYLKDKLKLILTEEEKLYLMLHINRLCTREDCNQ